MLTEFNNLPEHSRVWIYQCNRSLTGEEQTSISEKIDHFLKQWTAHGSDLEAAFELRYNRFIIIGINQEHTKASGCSIDASVRMIQNLEQEYQVDLLDKMNVSFKQGPHLVYKSLLEFKQMIKDGAVSKKTIVFNNLVQNKGEYLTHWEVPVTESWHARLM